MDYKKFQPHSDLKSFVGSVDIKGRRGVSQALPDVILNGGRGDPDVP